jgi:uncharacterized membrane protein
VNRSNQDNDKVVMRILTFSDGVFAIAILLLLIDIKLPAGTTAANLGSTLISLWPNYLAFFISFIVIGLYWSAHVRLFREIIRYDWVLVWLNLLYLFFIVIIPFSTAILSGYGETLPVIIYAGIISCAGYMNTFVRLYSMRNHRLVSSDLRASDIRKGIILSLIAPFGFTISIGIAFISSLAAECFWIGTSVIHVVFQRLVKFHKG